MMLIAVLLHPTLCYCPDEPVRARLPDPWRISSGKFLAGYEWQ
jgi:hypothetical protein